LKAGIFHEQGGLDVLRYEDVADPVPARGEVVLQVEAAALNRLDVRAREGRPEVCPMPHIGGLDVVGRVAATGEDAGTWKPGDRVVVLPILSCGGCAFCRGGDPGVCVEQRVFGFQTQGGFAEYVAVPARNLVRVSEGVRSQVLAAAPTAYGTAWHMLLGRARMRPGETVLIHSVGSGVGAAALDIVRYFGGSAIVTASSDGKLERAREMGARATINYLRGNTADVVLEQTSGQGADIVVDTVGTDTWEMSLASVARNGRIVTCGVTSGSIAPTNIRSVYQRQVAILGSTGASRPELEAALALVAGGQLRPFVDCTLPLSSIREAHARMERREQFGKIVVSVRVRGAHSDRAAPDGAAL
jgi:NADPH:quinone reductase-like Zn-dependent oxidoreductase